MKPKYQYDRMKGEMTDAATKLESEIVGATSRQLTNEIPWWFDDALAAEADKAGDLPYDQRNTVADDLAPEARAAQTGAGRDSLAATKKAQRQRDLGRLREMNKGGLLDSEELYGEYQRLDQNQKLPPEAQTRPYDRRPGTGYDSEMGRKTTARTAAERADDVYSARPTHGAEIDAPSPPDDPAMRRTEVGGRGAAAKRAAQAAPSGPKDPALKLTEPAAKVSGSRSTTPLDAAATWGNTGKPAQVVGKASDVVADLKKIQQAISENRFFGEMLQEEEVMDALIRLEQMAPGEVVRQGSDEAVDAAARIMTKLYSNPKSAAVLSRLAPGMRVLGGVASRAAGPLAIAGNLYDAYQMGSALEDTQDPIEQLRYVYDAQGGRPLTVGRGGVSVAAMQKLSEENPQAFFKAVDEGLLDPSVADAVSKANEQEVEDSIVLKGELRPFGEPVKRTVGGGEKPTSEKKASAFPVARKSRADLLSEGAQGGSVREAKMMLQNAGFNPGSFSDSFDADMTDAVKDFQKVAGIRVDGVVGPATRKALMKYIVEQRSGRLR